MEADVTVSAAPVRSPAFILVEPQMGENIGAAARALRNCGLDSSSRPLRLVNPRDPWPHNLKAHQMAAGADDILEAVQVFETVAHAVADLTFVLATTARYRDMVKPVLAPEAAIGAVRKATATQGRAGILFGPERSGLLSQDLTHAHGLIVIPLNPAFSSLNLAQAVFLLAYEWWKSSGDAENTPFLRLGNSLPASGHEVEGFFQHLEEALDGSGFLYPSTLRPTMLRNLRNLFLRAQMTEQEVRTLRGVLTSFQKGPRNRYIHKEIFL